MTKYHRLGILDNRNLFPHCSEVQKSNSKVLAGLMPSEAFLLGS